jgi:hypothetical protein
MDEEKRDKGFAGLQGLLPDVDADFKRLQEQGAKAPDAKEGPHDSRDQPGATRGAGPRGGGISDGTDIDQGTRTAVAGRVFWAIAGTAVAVALFVWLIVPGSMQQEPGIAASVPPGAPGEMVAARPNTATTQASVRPESSDSVGSSAQIHEPLAESVRGRLSVSIADRSAPELVFRNQDDGRRWIQEMSRRLESRIVDRKQRLELLRTVHFEALRAGLDPQLVLGVIDVVSGFHKYAVSHEGARGYMQVMPFWVKLVGNRGDNLFHLRTNLRYGCVILRHYLDVENGDYYRALGRYNGSLGNAEFPRAVLAAWKVRWGYSGPTS